MFIVVGLSLMFLLHGYVGARFIAPFELGSMSLVTYWIVLFLLAVLPMSAMMLRFRGIENDMVDWLLWIGYSSLGIFSLAFVIFLVRDLGWITGTLATKITGLLQTQEAVDAGPALARRQFIILMINWGILGLTLILGLIGFFQARFQPMIKKIDVPLNRYSTELGKLRIVQITDLHVGPTIKASYVRDVVRRVNDLDPDLILFTGDMVDGSVKRLTPDVEPLRALKAQYGTYFVTGNHEYYSGAESWVAKASELGMRPLMNEHIILDINGTPLVLAGVTDFMAHQILKSHRSDPGKALQGAPEDTTTLLMAHQPATADLVHELDIDLMVCGHTHGGQYIPFNWAVGKAHKYVTGLYKQSEMHVYVNQGTGYWGPPLRLGIPAEITLFNFTKA